MCIGKFTLSTALADFVVAHLLNNPDIEHGKRNIELGQIASFMKDYPQLPAFPAIVEPPVEIKVGL